MVYFSDAWNWSMKLILLKSLFISGVVIDFVLFMKNSQVVNTVLILIGAVMLLYSIAVEDAPVYFKIIGLVVIMFGLFRATNFWVETKDDHKKENEEE